VTRTRLVLIVAIVLVALVGGVVAAVLVTRSGDTEWSAPAPTGESAPDGLDAFYGQKLDWEDCDGDRCTWVEVPVDYAKPDGETTRLRVRVIPSSSGDAKRSLFVNPGGPGGSAVDYAGTVSTQVGTEVRETYDFVGVDPRGVGESTPLECLSDEEFDAYVQIDPDPDDASEITAFRESLTELGQACLDNSGDLAAHVSTVEAARDMDIVRALLGREKLDWFGASYGTQLGATYAELFPDRVGRMVLDGAVDPTLDATESALGQATGFQRAVEAYAKDCVTSDECPLGDDAEAGLDKIADLLQQLDEKPLPGLPGRELTEGNAFYGIAVTLYDERTWPVLSQALELAFDGNGAGLLSLSDAYFRREEDGSYAQNIGQVITAVNCLDAADDRDLTLEQAQASIPEFEKVSPVFGESLAWGTLACTDWPVKATNPLPDIDGAGAPPILVLGTTRDPATPYEWAEALASQLESAVLITREGDGHTAYGAGNPCITKVVDAYLVDGTVPKDGLVCD
jgi:pimeloyl-ACP methyl ester carboxylesterase